MWSPDEGKTIRFCYHHTDLVEYTAETLTIRFYDSRSSEVFIGELAPHGIQARMWRGELVVNNMLPRVSTLLFNLVNGQWVVDPSTVAEQHQCSVDRKIGYKVAKLAKPFLEYRRARVALQGVRQATGLMAPNCRLVEDLVQLEDLVQRVADPEHWPNLFVYTANVSDIAIHRALVARADGIRKTLLPIGRLPTKSVYDGL